MAIEDHVMADLLMRKYSLLKQEVWAHIGFYKAHVARFQLMGTAILAAAAYVISNPATVPNNKNWWLWWLATTLFPVMANYLIFDIIESQYAMILLGERMATIEEDVNRIAGCRLLIWETFGAPMFWQSFRPMPGVINPDWFLSSFGLIIATSMAVVIPSFLYYLLWNVSGGSTRHASVIAGLVIMIAAMAASVSCCLKILLSTRGKPRAFFRQILSASPSGPDGKAD
ncbi:MAG TPA: hypothetical protein VFE33_24195 [Thermoanaerobaculia bacterium]|nr:hypothetical protein [Thermoanaerobaculia bacterium]